MIRHCHCGGLYSDDGGMIAGRICTCGTRTPATQRFHAPAYAPLLSKPAPPNVTVPAVQLTEDDVRRIVREELARARSES